MVFLKKKIADVFTIHLQNIARVCCCSCQEKALSYCHIFSNLLRNGHQIGDQVNFISVCLPLRKTAAGENVKQLLTLLFFIKKIKFLVLLCVINTCESFVQGVYGCSAKRGSYCSGFLFYNCSIFWEGTVSKSSLPAVVKCLQKRSNASFLTLLITNLLYCTVTDGDL